ACRSAITPRARTIRPTRRVWVNPKNRIGPRISAPNPNAHHPTKQTLSPKVRSDHPTLLRERLTTGTVGARSVFELHLSGLRRRGQPRRHAGLAALAGPHRPKQ